MCLCAHCFDFGNHRLRVDRRRCNYWRCLSWIRLLCDFYSFIFYRMSCDTLISWGFGSQSTTAECSNVNGIGIWWNNRIFHFFQCAHGTRTPVVSTMRMISIVICAPSRCKRWAYEDISITSSIKLSISTDRSWYVIWAKAYFLLSRLFRRFMGARHTIASANTLPSNVC